MEKMIGACGITCSKCDAFLALKENYSMDKRKKIAEKWSKEYGGDIKAADIACEGCQSNTNNIFSHCKICEIRKCAREKNIENCAHCDKYPCDGLVEFWKKASPDAKANLDGMRK